MSERSERLEGRVAVVTGVGAGIGAAVAATLARDGATVIGTEIDEAAGRATMDGLPGCSLLVNDIGDVAASEALLADVVASHGRIDVLVNNAGVTKSLGFFDVTEADWDRIYRVNAKGLFFCMQAAARHMSTARRGRIINIASIAGKGYRGTSNVAYAGSKGAVIAMTRIAAAQLARYDVTVNAVCPGATRTNLYRQIMGEMTERQGISEEAALARLDKSIPLRRSNEPSDIAEMVAFLASDAARNITGQSYNVDGGLVWD